MGGAAKGFDGYGPLGPVITSGIDPASLAVRTILNGTGRQNYPTSKSAKSRTHAPLQ